MIISQPPFLAIRATKSVTSILRYTPENHSFIITELKFNSEDGLPEVLHKIKVALVDIISTYKIDTIYVKDVTPGAMGVDPERYMIHGVIIQASFEAGVQNILFRKKVIIKNLFHQNKHYLDTFGKETKFDLDLYSKNANEFKEFCTKMLPELNIENIKNNNTRETLITAMCPFVEKMEKFVPEPKRKKKDKTTT